MNHRLIRFDVRLPESAYVTAFWNEEHRKQFLLQPTIGWPLSVDPMVWPSIFFSPIFQEANKLPYGNIEVDPATDEGEYWLNLEQMKAHYEAHKRPDANGIFVCIQLFSEKSLADNLISYVERDGIQCGLRLGHASPSEPPPGSEIIGYDVADASWISGLTNCGYTAEEKRRLGPLWTRRLNSFGLLNTLEDAIEFRQLSDTRVPEHAPFWLYGISQLPGGRSIGISEAHSRVLEQATPR